MMMSDCTYFSTTIFIILGQKPISFVFQIEHLKMSVDMTNQLLDNSVQEDILDDNSMFNLSRSGVALLDPFRFS